MFDLEKQIVEWRQKLLAAGIKAPVPLDELENHLRSEIERLMQAGMDAKESCETAMEKMGAANALQIEFAKVEKENRAAREARLTLVFSLMAIWGMAAAMAVLVVFRVGTFSEMTSAQQNSAYAALSLMLFFGFGGRFGHKFFPRIGRKQIRYAICVSAGAVMAVWWTILFWVILPRHDYSLAEILLLIIWGFVMPVGLIVGLCAGIETAARQIKTADAI
jgi:cation transport ATPase